MARRKDEDDEDLTDDSDLGDDTPEEDAALAEDEDEAGDDGRAGDDDDPDWAAASADGTPVLDIFEQDDEDAAELGADDDSVYLDDEDDDRKPFWLRPIFLASVVLVMFLSLAVVAAYVTFDREAYEAAAVPPSAVVALALPPPPGMPVEGAPGEAAANPGAVPPEGTPPAAAAAPTPGAPAPAGQPPTGAQAAVAQPAVAPPILAPGIGSPVGTPAAPPPANAGTTTARATAPGAPATTPPGQAGAAAPPAAPQAPATPLAPAPDPGLVEAGPAGPLPTVGQDGRQPWKVYARPFAEASAGPRIAIVIGGLGLSRAATQAAIQQLPPEVTLAFAPYAPNLEAQIAEARAAGHEVILQLPMEPDRYPANDPGPHTMLTTASPEVNLERLHWVLARFSGYIGVTNYMGAKMSSSADALRPILKDISDRGLLFLDAREATDGVASTIASELGMPRVINNMFLDGEASRAGVDGRLLDLERTATRGGNAIGIGYAYPVTIERVGAWVRTLRDKNMTLAPISALARTSSSN